MPAIACEKPGKPGFWAGPELIHKHAKRVIHIEIELTSIPVI
jgi:hypothetical protein